MKDFPKFGRIITEITEDTLIAYTEGKLPRYSAYMEFGFPSEPNRKPRQLNVQIISVSKETVLLKQNKLFTSRNGANKAVNYVFKENMAKSLWKIIGTIHNGETSICIHFFPKIKIGTYQKIKPKTKTLRRPHIKNN